MRSALHNSFTSACFFVLYLLASSVSAQTPDEHAAHHPPEAAAPSSQPAPERGQGMMSGGMGQMMDGMMEKMGAPKPRDLYPSLMSLPNLPHEQRHDIEFQAHRRMVDGAELMEKALSDLSAAARREDFRAMQEAVPLLREGVAQFDSGLAAHRALAEGRAPRNVALSWFKREMNLSSPSAQAGQETADQAMHYVVMAILAAFAVAMIGMYFLKMRRAASLLKALREPGSVASAITSVPETPSKARDSASGRSAEQARVTTTSVGSSQVAVPEPQPAPHPPPKFPVMKSASEPVDKWRGALRVCRVFEEARGVRTFRLAALDHIALPFTYFPGQFMTVSAPIAGKTVRRSYTIASSPTQLHYASITVKREDHGVFSRYLHDEIEEGDTLDVVAPNGKFTFTGTEADGIVLIAGGVGLTPMMSIIRYLTDIGWHKDIYLLFCCRTTSDFMFREELEQLQERHPNLHVFASMTRADGAIWMGLKGRFTKEILSHLVPEIEKHRVHVCGPPPMMEAMLSMLAELGVPEEQVHTEAFGPARPPNRSISAREDRLVAVDESTDAQEHHVRFIQANKEGVVRGRSTILDLADSIGVDIDNSCRTGQCGMCKVKLRSGQVTMEAEDALSDEEKKEGVILACQAIPSTDTEVEA